MTATEAEPATDDKIRCDACPVMCYIKPGALGACDRYANVEGNLVRVDPHVMLSRIIAKGGEVVPFAEATGMGRRHSQSGRNFRHRDRRRDDLSRL